MNYARTKLLAPLALLGGVLLAPQTWAQINNGGVSTAPVFTSSSEPASRIQTFTNTARWAVDTGPAVEISNTGAAIINIQAGGIVSGSATTGTIVTRGFTALTSVTINNSGSIINTSGASAISATATRASGLAIDLIVNNTGSIIGNIGSGEGNDEVLNSNGVIIGSINLGNGTNAITINGGAMTGDATTGVDNDRLTLDNNALLTGNVNLGEGNNIANINSSTLNGNILTGNSGNNFMTVTNGTVSGSINLGAGVGDILAISGTLPFTTRGTIGGADSINVSASTVNVRHGINDTAALRISNNSRVNVSQSFSLVNGGSLITNRGILHLGAGTVVSTGFADFTNGGRLIVDVVNASNFGQLVVGAGGMGVASYTVNLQGAGYITSGTTMTIVDANAASTLAANSLTNSGQQGVHNFVLGLVNGGTDVQLTIQRVSTSSLVGDIGGKNAADVLEGMGNAAPGELYAVQNAITNATTAGQVASLAESLTPAIDGLGAATLGAVQATGVQISNRLASLNNTQYAGSYGVATGMGLTSNHVWLEGFGNAQTQDDLSSGPGFEASGYGITFGLDSDDFMDGANLGMAFTYALGTVEGNGGNQSNADVTSYLGTLYGSTVYESGIFLNAMAGLGWNEYDLTRTIGAGVGQAKASTTGWQGTGKAELGFDLPLGNLTITPVLGAQATYLSVDSYTETGGGTAGLTVKPEAMATLDASAGVRAAYTVALADGTTVRPMIRASAVNRSGDKALNSTSQFRGGGAAFKTPGAESESTAFVLGAGLLLATAGGTDFTADYDAEIRSSSLNHVFKLKSRIPF
jgi:outer membrane autotransporter protein